MANRAEHMHAVHSHEAEHRGNLADILEQAAEKCEKAADKIDSAAVFRSAAKEMRKSAAFHSKCADEMSAEAEKISKALVPDRISSIPFGDAPVRAVPRRGQPDVADLTKAEMETVPAQFRHLLGNLSEL